MAQLICPECAKVEIPEGAASCPNCGYPIEIEEETSFAEETVLREGFVTFTNVTLGNVLTAMSDGLTTRSQRRAQAARNNLAANGRGVLTDKRFVFGKGKALKKMAVGTSVDFTECLACGDVIFDIPIADITSVIRGKQGFSTLFIINTSAGETYNFAVMKKSAYEEWQAAFDKVVIPG